MIWTDGKLSPNMEGLFGLGVGWFRLGGFQNASFLVPPSSLVRFCFVCLFRFAYQANGGRFGDSEGSDGPVPLLVCFFCFWFPLGPAMFHQFLLRFLPSPYPLFVCLLFGAPTYISTSSRAAVRSVGLIPPVTLPLYTSMTVTLHYD